MRKFWDRPVRDGPDWMYTQPRSDVYMQLIQYTCTLRDVQLVTHLELGNTSKRQHGDLLPPTCCMRASAETSAWCRAQDACQCRSSFRCCEEDERGCAGQVGSEFTILSNVVVETTAARAGLQTCSSYSSAAQVAV
jgi:hypothetical protein